MIHIIGTQHSLQVWSDARRAGQTDIPTFEAYLVEAARALWADVIAEESNAEFVARYVGGTSVAMGVAERLGVKHLYCDPDSGERRALGIKTGDDLTAHARAVAANTGEDWMDVHDREVLGLFPAREAVWIERLKPYAGREVLFVCGADHSTTFKASLDAAGLAATIYCRDWTEL